jgi:hypothetical protein
MLLWRERMLDDLDSTICNKKHYGPILRIEGEFAVMRCSFCEQIIKYPMFSDEEREEKRRSSRTCISDCDWITDDTTVRCRSCSYIGPLPTINQAEEKKTDLRW